MQDLLLRVNNLCKYFPLKKGLVFGRKVADVRAVDGISFSIRKGETLGLVGESGSGKTTAGKCVLRLIEPTAGEVLFEDVDILHSEGEELRKLRRRMQTVFQDPYGSLDPRQNVASIIGEPLIVHGLAGGNQVKEKVDILLKMVGLEPGMGRRYPHMFSGGQRQRIGIARALATGPSFLVCDEPVSALDVSIQAQIVNLLEELKRSLQLTLLFIAHDVSVVRHISDRIAVMYLGRIVEIASSNDLCANPLHPYSQALLFAVPIPDPALERQRERLVLAGEIPSPINPPSGCHFHPRCGKRMDICSDVSPQLREANGRQIACHLYS